MDNVKKKIIAFCRKVESDQNHRYKSWEHCYSYFSQKNIDKNIACLHLSFYLASWGMYRGSSFLLWKDYLIHQNVVEKILNNLKLQKINFSNITEYQIEEIFKLIHWIKNWYKDNVKSVNALRKNINATDTLITKILLGTLACVPAYDRYFIAGFRLKGLKFSTLTKKNFRLVVNFYIENKQAFDSSQKEIYHKSGIKYPTMKLVDMYFWQIGFEADN
ncbi:MAG: hypothetical protein DRP78_05680 [Candidatus Omnitrophota bacterium]|nr:MAG: hypothetical protein DRP78_05680 [Candidatus Omnitrophota bacterium]